MVLILPFSICRVVVCASDDERMNIFESEESVQVVTIDGTAVLQVNIKDNIDIDKDNIHLVWWVYL